MIFRFTRAVFGLVQSPFLLNGVIQHHLDKWKDHASELVQNIKDNIYVDDIIEGGDQIEEMTSMKKAIILIFNAAKFQLHKWHSNKAILEGESPNKEEHVTNTVILGLNWDKQKDTLQVTTHSISTSETKRGVLKFLASFYDPLGFISPVTLKYYIEIFATVNLDGIQHYQMTSQID